MKGGSCCIMKKLLIIDDEFIFRQGLRYLLDWEACGYTIISEASNGQEGLAALEKYKPDFILCDVVMPVMDGVEFVRYAREKGSPPVIMLSNFDEFSKVRHAFQYGASDYLLKSSITKESLLKCLERFSLSLESSSSKKSEKSFSVLARQVLDGYAPLPFQELQDYIHSRFLPTRTFRLLYIATPVPDFKDEYHFHEKLEALLPGNEFCCAFTTQNHGICLIGCPDRQESAGTEEFLHLLSKIILHTSCVLSLPFDDLALFLSKAELLHDLSKYSILFEDKRCFCESELTAPSEAVPDFASDVYMQYIRSCRFERAFIFLSEYLDVLKNTTKTNPLNFKKFLEYTFYISIQSARKFVKNGTDLNHIEIHFFKALDLALSFHDVGAALKAAYEGLASCISGDVSLDSVSLIPDMQKFLEENYTKQITLYDLADYLHMNYSYLSTYITANTGRHFSEHLNDIRIRHAKDFLVQTEESISSISAAIGYTDQSYFGKIFKKIVGLPPLQYRNLNRKGRVT